MAFHFAVLRTVKAPFLCHFSNKLPPKMQGNNTLNALFLLTFFVIKRKLRLDPKPQFFFHNR